jgi:hypothetical protein
VDVVGGSVTIGLREDVAGRMTIDQKLDARHRRSKSLPGICRDGPHDGS